VHLFVMGFRVWVLGFRVRAPVCYSAQGIGEAASNRATDRGSVNMRGGISGRGEKRLWRTCVNPGGGGASVSLAYQAEKGKECWGVRGPRGDC
jgi:hypothetical protein